MVYSILILGGYGNFGGKISAKLAKDLSIRVIIAGRKLQKQRAFLQKSGKKLDSRLM